MTKNEFLQSTGNILDADIITFPSVNNAINYVIDKELRYINMENFERQMMNGKAYYSKSYNKIFIVDEHNILTTD